ncbi:hypothetical protein AMEX_G7700 [Astyanax mexicanus]|uniref:Uncharacterized protein n=1 Tax=Astyanax mexicanus TaxID=7994 RepID=A0A8T2M1W2_ASTMX|nr:hypothetical protein AMEX_G7700 [Astyanax mexicanus]
MPWFGHLHYRLHRFPLELRTIYQQSVALSRDGIKHSSAGVKLSHRAELERTHRDWTLDLAQEEEAKRGKGYINNRTKRTRGPKHNVLLPY